MEGREKLPEESQSQPPTLTLAYTLNIPIKTITSLEMYACGTNDMDKKLVIIRDVKGVFYGLFDKDNNQIGELEYKANADFEEFVNVELLIFNPSKPQWSMAPLLFKNFEFLMYKLS